MASLGLRGIVKRFGKQTVLDGIDLDVADGETLVLFGPSGAGKTVLLRLVAGVIDPDEGSVLIDGRSMEGVDAEERDVGMAFQNFALFPHMSAQDNIASPLEARGLDRSAISRGVEGVARLLKIDHVLDHRPRALSNGQKQRTALARALVASPSLLLLDDPLRNVDAKLRFEMRLELPRLLAGNKATVVYVTQDYKEAMALGHRIAVLEDGHIRQIGTPEEIYLRPANMRIARLFGEPAINLLDVRPRAGNGGAVADLFGATVRVAEAGIGRDCVLGLRPETLHFVAGAGEGVLQVKVEAEMPLNEKTVTLATVADGRELLVSRPAGTPGPAEGTQAFVAVDGANAMLFDREKGAALALQDGVDQARRAGA